MTRWRNIGFRMEHSDTYFRNRLDALDQEISAAARNNASMRRVAP
jgi:hypothetical protein